ncbi:hypothetical protein FOA52_008992 [Chlamydomonas sp. UWO 241]|nr:hypothetical protein FOA52_008992 [Chlamydomonas sp. UWO 241]
MADPPPASTSTQEKVVVDGEERRKKELRQAGADYLEAALASATKGEDPLRFEDRIRKERKAKKARADDPEFVAFGDFLKNWLVYVYIALYIACQASSYVLVKMSFHYMQTPAVLAFLHMLAGAGAVALGCRVGVFETLQLSMVGLRGSSVRIVLYATQLLCTFSALHHNSLNVVLVWTTAGSVAIESAVNSALGGRPLSPQATTALAVSFGAGVLELVFDSDKVAVGLLMLLLFSVSKAAESVWRHMRTDATLGGRIIDDQLLSRIERLVDDEAQLGGATLALMQNLVPAVPVLLLGFVALEGEELVTHELSVPGVKVMLLACVAYAAATCCQLLLDDQQLRPSTKLFVRGGALLGAVVMFAAEAWAAVGAGALVLTLTSVGASLFVIQRASAASQPVGDSGGGALRPEGMA